MAPSPYGNRSVLAPVPPPVVTHQSLLGLDHSVSGSSHFALWIDGKGPFVPLPLPSDEVPQAVVLNEWSHGQMHMVFESGVVDDGSFNAYPSPIIAPGNYRGVPYNNVPTQCHETSDFPIVDLGRYTDALAFQSFFVNRSSTNGCNKSVEKGTFILPNGTLSWSGKSCGITWVAVHGMDSLCVVTRNEDLEREVTPRVRSLERMKEDLLHKFRKGIIYKVEDLADQMLKPRQTLEEVFSASISKRSGQMSGPSFMKPFGCVAVIPGNHEGSGNEAPGAEYDEANAIKFLHDEMRSNTAFTVNKTVQTAISALQHLFHKKFKANEIKVIVRKDGDVVKELPSRDDRSIEEQIATIRAGGADSYHTV